MNVNDYEIEDGIIKKYIGSGGEVVVPVGVKEIGNTSFVKCKTITSVTLPEGLEYIGYGAFCDCINLKKAVLPEGLEKVHNFIFQGCENLTEVVLPSTLKHLGRGMFQNCKRLEFVDLPEGLQELSDWTFWGCESLKELWIPDSVTSIWGNLFKNCHALYTVRIGTGMYSEYQWDMFKDCVGLKNIVIPDNHPRFKIVDGVVYSSNGDTLYYCPIDWEGEFIIPNEVKTIFQNAFAECMKLTKIAIPEGVEEIGHSAFTGCENLSEVTIPASVQKIGGKAFHRATHKTFDWNRKSPKSYEKITVSLEAGKHFLGSELFDLQPEDAMTPLVYPELPLTMVQETNSKLRLVWGYCLNIEKYSEEYAKQYQKYAKSQKKKILAEAKNCKIPGVEEYYEKLEVEEQKKKTSSKKKVVEEEKTVLKSVSEKPKETARENFIIEEGILTQYVGTLNHVIIPSKVTTIKSDAFKDCVVLKEVRIPSTVKLVESNAFYGCSKLQKVIFDAGVEVVAKKAFVKCKALKEVIILGDDITLEQDLFKAKKDIQILAPNLSPSKFAMAYREQIIEAFANAYEKGAFVSLSPKSKMLAYIKRQNHQMYPYLKTMPGLFKVMIDFKLISPNDANDVFEMLSGEGVEVSATLLEYVEKNGKKENLTSELTLELSEEPTKPMTIAEIKKDWAYQNISYHESVLGRAMDGVILTKYKGFKTDVVVPSYVGKKPVLAIQYGTFESKAQEVTSVLIPETVVEICDSAFINCRKLKRVEILGEEIKFGSSVFDNCVELEELSLKAKKMRFGIHPFQNCVKLMDKDGFVILEEENRKILCDCDMPIMKSELIVPDGVVRIEGYAFAARANDWECSAVKNLKKVVLPSSLKEIGYSVFSKACNLETVIIPEGVEKIGRMAFFECKSLRKIDIPRSVTNLEPGIFYRCENVTIYGEEGSVVEAYAKKDNIPFVIGK